MQKPKIGVIGLKGLPAFGGAAAVGENIIENLKEEYDFTVYSTSSHTDLPSGKLNGYKQRVFKKLPLKKLNTLYYYIISALHAVLFAKYDLIHLHHRDAAFITLFLKLKYKVLLTTHGSFNIRPKWKRYKAYFNLQVKYFVGTADRVICVSKSEERQYNDRLNINARHIPNGINIMKTFNLPELDFSEEYIFFGAGRIIRSKGCDVLLKALNNIKYEEKVLVAGDLNQTPDHKKELTSLAKELNVEFLGLIKDKALLMSYLKNSKLFIFPSNYEAMSMMLLEAASVRAQIICSDIIENKDVFTDKEVLFFKTDDYIDLGEKITWALINNNKMKERANNAFVKSKQDYNWSVIASQYSQEFSALL